MNFFLSMPIFKLMTGLVQALMTMGSKHQE